MPADRTDLIWRFLIEGQPDQIAQSQDRIRESTEKLQRSSEQLSKTQQAEDDKHQQRVQRLREHKSALDEFTQSTYLLGMGSVYAGIPMNNLAAVLANGANGAAMMAQGLSGLAAGFGTVGLAAGAAVVSIGAVGLAISKTVEATTALTQSITRLSEATSLNLAQTSRELLSFSAMFGGQAAGSILGSIGAAQSNLSALGYAQMAAASRAAQSNPNYFMPLYGGLARMGISTVQPGSTIFNPSFKDPAVVLQEVATRLADVTDPAKKQLYGFTVEQSLGKDVAESAQLLARELRYAREHGGTDVDVFRRMQGAGLDFTLSEIEQHKVDELTIAGNEFHQALSVLLADLGTMFLPAITTIIRTVTNILESIGGKQGGVPFGATLGSTALGGAAGFMLGGPLGALAGAALGAALTNLPHHASGGPVPAGQLSITGESGPELFLPSQPGSIIPNNAIAGFMGLLGMIPNTGSVVSQLLRNISNQIDSIGGAAMLASRPLKDFISLLNSMLSSWKAAGFAQMTQEVMQWGQEVAVQIHTVIGAIGELEAKLSEGLPQEAINFVMGAVPQLPTLPSVVVNIVPKMDGQAFDRIMGEPGEMWQLTHDRSLSIMPTIDLPAFNALVTAQPGPYWEMTHDRSLSIIPTVDMGGVIAALKSIPAVINIGVRTVPIGNTPSASDQLDRANGVLGADVTVNPEWRHAQEVAAAAQATGVPAAVIEAIMQTEGSGDTATSPSGAMGPMQVMGSHFREGENPFDLQTNITRGAEVLKSGFNRFGNWASAAAAYFGAVDANGNPTGSTDAGGMNGVRYVQRFQNFLSQLAGSTGPGGLRGEGGLPPARDPDGNQGNIIGGDSVLDVPFGAAVSTGGGGGGGSGNAGKAIQDLIKKLQDGTATFADFAQALAVGDPIIRRLFDGIRQDADPTQALTDQINTLSLQLGDLGNVSADTLSQELPASSVQALQALNQLAQSGDLNLSAVQDALLNLNDAGQMGLADQLPAASLASLNALGLLSSQGQTHFSKLGNALQDMSGIAVENLGTEIPGASDESGKAMNLLQLVTNRLKAQGFDPTSVSIGAMSDELVALGGLMPQLNPVIQGLIAQLNAIPRDVRVNITTFTNGVPAPSGGGGSSGGSRSGIPQGGLAPGTGLNGPNTPAPVAFTGGGGGGGLHVMAEGGMLMEPVYGFGLHSGESYLMGESGPEAVIPAGRRGGGLTINNYITVQAMDFNDPGLVRKIAQAAGDQIAFNLRVSTGLGRAI